ncbi:MAG: hypothetical protein R3Y24_08685 [Eubacteriales bacterium]
MSCHNIGRGMDSVVQTVIGMYDNKELSLMATKKVIRSAREGVHWCDGNEYEAIDCIRGIRCGCCLENIEEVEEEYSLWHLGGEFRHIDFLDESEEVIASDMLCETCFKRVVDGVIEKRKCTKK